MNWQVGTTLAEVEKQIIQQALAYFKDNQTLTAQALGIDRKTIANKLKSYEEMDAKIKHQDEQRKKKNEFERLRHLGKIPPNAEFDEATGVMKPIKAVIEQPVPVQKNAKHKNS